MKLKCMECGKEMISKGKDHRKRPQYYCENCDVDYVIRVD